VIIVFTSQNDIYVRYYIKLSLSILLHNPIKLFIRSY